MGLTREASGQDDAAWIHEIERIQRPLDRPHHAQRYGGFVLLQLVEFEAAHTVLGRNRTAEFRH